MSVGFKVFSCGALLGVLSSAMSGCGGGHEFSNSAGTAGSASPGAASGAGGANPSGGSAVQPPLGGEGGVAPEGCAPGDSQSCYESPEGTAYAGKPPTGQMTCRLGTQKCGDDGTWGVCVGAVAPLPADTCDAGNDSNCNGTPNEGCDCKESDTRACGTDVGNCVQGQQTCKSNAWGECVGEVKAAASDSCEKDDDANCNGMPHDSCACYNGETKSCGTDVGPCEFGTRTCVNGVWPAACTGGVAPAATDTCEAGNDANCNNTPNEGCKCKSSDMPECGSDVGACKKGKQSCTNGTLSSCMGGVNPTTNDTCLAHDAANDTNCNGTTGDGCECVLSDGPKKDVCGDTGCGQRLCDGATGKLKACSNVNSANRCNPSNPTQRQVCGANGVFIAQECNQTEQCTGQGICKSKDGEQCANGTTCATGSCNPYYPDADSDSYRKEGSAVVNLCGAGKTGYVAASANKGDDCDDGTDKVNPGKKEACDGVDNDCDGLVDFADTDPLVLSGNAKATATGTFSGIASSGANYGFMYFKPSTTQMFFSTLTQANAVTTPKDIVIGTDYNVGVIAYDGSNFGVFQRDSFRRVTPSNGALSTAVTLASTAGATERWAAARVMSGSWLLVGTMSYGNPFGFADMISAADVESHDKVADISVSDGTVRWPDTAVSGTTFGVVWETGVGPNSIVFSPRTSTGAASASVPALATGNGLTKPVIAARNGGGGFVILWADGSKIYLKEVTTSGSEICATVSKAFANFLPEQMVPTSRGYLAVSGAGKTVRAQEILPACMWGGALPTIGTADLDTKPRIAKGNNGFAVIWDQDPDAEKTVYTRTFGPNFCD